MRATAKGGSRLRLVECGRPLEERVHVSGNKTRWVAPTGALLVIVSVVFEFARMKPTNQYLVEPWSLRGYEMTIGAL